MLKEEFEKMIGEEVSPDDYKIIEYVYQFHPAISNTDGKKEIAALYQLPNQMGMGIIRSMVPVAKIQESLESELRSAQMKVNDIKRRMQQVKNGNYADEECRKDVLLAYNNCSHDKTQWLDVLCYLEHIHGPGRINDILVDLNMKGDRNVK